MQESEDTAGGMSYRTMKGIDITNIMNYLKGYDAKSAREILDKNKDYYITSANKTIARLELTKKRVEYGHIEPKCAEMIYEKISNATKWLKELKNEIKHVNNETDLLNFKQYKKWHAVKLIPSAAEGIVITSSINWKIANIINNKEYNQDFVDMARIHNEKSRSIFLELLNLTEHSDFKAAEQLRIKAYGESVLADKKIKF
jgi:hypothetical protein